MFYNVMLWSHLSLFYLSWLTHILLIDMQKWMGLAENKLFFPSDPDNNIINSFIYRNYLCKVMNILLLCLEFKVCSP